MDLRTDRMILKEKAINYFKQNGIPKIVENSLNDLFRDFPNDACGYLSKYFENLSEEIQLSKIKASESTGDLGNIALSLKLFGISRNEEIELAHITFPNNVNAKSGEIITIDHIVTNENNVRRCIDIIEQHLSQSFIGIDPHKHDFINETLREDALEKQQSFEVELRNNQEVDKDEMKKDTPKDTPKDKVTSGKNKKPAAVTIIPDDPPELISPDLKAHFAVSVAIATFGGMLEKQDLYRYTLDRLGLISNQTAKASLPAIPVLTNGKGLPGKCQLIKRCLLLPNGLYDTPVQVAADLRLATLKLSATVQSKSPTTTTNDRGELIPAYDRPEQFLDTINDVLKETELDGKIKVILEIGASGIFDFTKGKYEIITGQLKSSDELVNFLKDLVDRYPVIVGLVNPLRKQDIEQWNNLAKLISEHCWIIGRSPQVFPRVQKFVEYPQYLDECPLKVSFIGLEIDGYSIYGDYIDCSQQFIETDRKMCIWLEDLCGQNWLMDLSCGLQAYFVVIPNIRCFSGANKLDHWVDIMSGFKIAPILCYPVLFNEDNEQEEKQNEQ